MESDNNLDPTNPDFVSDLDTNGNTSTEPLEKSNTQKRIDELVAVSKAAEERAKLLETQNAQLIASLTQREPQRTEEPTFVIPEGVDPATAKFFKAQLDAQAKQLEHMTRQLVNNVAGQTDAMQFDQKYAHVPADLRNEAKKFHAFMTKKYGDANMDDAMRMTLGDAMMKGNKDAQRLQFNAGAQPIASQTAMSNFSPPVQQSNSLAAPSSRADWDSLPIETQIKLIDDYEKKGGKIIG